MSKVKVTVEGEVQGQLDVKRFQLPGLTVRGECPECSKPFALDLKSHYLSYPTVGTPVTVHTCCEHCDREFAFDVTVRLTLEPA
jgi:hypothetical protein